MFFDFIERFLLVAIVAVSILLVGCGDNQDDALDSTFELSAESMITALSGSADDHSGESYASANLRKQNIADLFLPKAYAATCTRAALETCSSGVKTATYSNCDISGTLLSLDGSVTLTYSDSGCGMASASDNVARTYDYTITGPRGGNLQVFSTALTDYRGTSISGGGKLTNTGSAWEIQVLGKNKILKTAAGVTIMSHSIRTLSNVTVTGGLSRASRVMNGGQVEVNHNLAKFTAVYTPNNLQWSSTCCHPVSGNLSVTFDGTVTGTGSVVFNGCGSATISKDDKERTITLSYCE
ncbi:MAG: hypothetical protein H6624_10565 [Bdellovibrionaceae bacterium]|nr:hypothetical protein [Bdellovibrionales bacterium]MCB9084778.1 hypothetical protein [Pseudobdellovibrionaceae bacterium]